LIPEVTSQKEKQDRSELMKATIKEFFRLESAGGILLMVAAVLALIVANSPAIIYYNLFLDVPVEVRIGEVYIAKPLVLWINDGLMAVFFFLIGLELKREILEGELSSMSSVALPALGALGGIVVQIAIYVWLNLGDEVSLAGWAIPASTDIAFALGILMLFGDRVPIALKMFLVSIAIFDDIAAIAIIAVFYSDDLSTLSLVIAGLCLCVLAIMNWRGVSDITPFIWVGAIMWVAVLKSGVHATLAGVALAAFIPMRSKVDPDRYPLKELEEDLHHVVAFGILPLFAFANAGVSFDNLGFSDLLHPATLGIIAGLFLGKQLGVFAFSWIAIKTGIAKIPANTKWGSIYGASLLAGIGFTMSMFVATLAFENSGADIRLMHNIRFGIIVASVLSAAVGAVVLHYSLPGKRAAEQNA